MRRESFKYTIEAVCRFTAGDLILLYHACAHHYDDTVQGMVKGGSISMLLHYLEVDGKELFFEKEIKTPNNTWTEEEVLAFLVRHKHATAARPLPFREYDLMCKALEYYATGAEVAAFGRSLGLDMKDPIDQALVAPLNIALRQTLDAINEEWRRLNDKEKAPSRTCDYSTCAWPVYPEWGLCLGHMILDADQMGFPIPDSYRDRWKRVLNRAGHHEMVNGPKHPFTTEDYIDA